jgi:hypothetical protein
MNNPNYRLEIPAGEQVEPESKPTLLKDIKPIKESRGAIIKTREQLRELVEPPLLPACEALYDKNIQTLETTANSEVIKYGGKAGIVIKFDTLSEENKNIAKRLCQVEPSADGYTVATIEVPVDENTSVAEIEEKTLHIANEFRKQPLTWTPKFTIEQLRVFYGLDADEEEYGPESFTSQMYYDANEKLFYLNKEQYEKAKDF